VKFTNTIYVHVTEFLSLITWLSI